jgi:predicted O-methyltransferase YrrM
MYSSFKLAQKYIRYYLGASNGKGHGIHSPFVFDLVVNVLNDRRKFDAYEKVETLRHELLKDRSLLEVEDFGAGSVKSGCRKHRSVRSLAGNAAKPPKLAQLIYRLVQHYSPDTIIELGTSLGLTTSYMALAAPATRIITVEGAPGVADVARRNFRQLGLGHIEQITGNFDGKLPQLLAQGLKPDMVFIDGNHRKQPTLDYFNMLLPALQQESFLIFDDIHWSAEMEEAWQAIKSHPAVMLTVDLFFLGLVFFRPEFKVPQHFTIRF